MRYTHESVAHLIQSVNWNSSGCIRLFWLRHTDGARDDLAQELFLRFNSEAVVPLVLRSAGFTNANSVLSDVTALFEKNRVILESLSQSHCDLTHLTILILAKDDFKLINVSSPITLPEWFPICAGNHTSFSIRDLGLTAELEPVNCGEARIEHVSELLYQLEFALVEKITEISITDLPRAIKFVNSLQTGGNLYAEISEPLSEFSRHLTSVSDPRSYRPNASSTSKFLSARILKLALNSSPKQLAIVAADLEKCFLGADDIEIKPTFFAMMWRPANKLSIQTTNWLAILVMFFQSYQLMNASAHAGEFPRYAVTLQHATSVNLRIALTEAADFIRALT